MELVQSAGDWIGGIIFFLSYIFTLTIAFQRSVGWGVGSLLLWPVMVVFVIKNFDKTAFWAGGMIVGIVIFKVF